MDIRERFSKFDDDGFLNVKEVAELLLTTPQAVYKRLDRDPATCPAPCVRTGKQTRFRVSDVRAWLRAQYVTSTPSINAGIIGRPRTQVERLTEEKS